MEDSGDEAFCRICYSEINPITKKNDLIAPCKCDGSVKHVHFTCLKLWRIRGKAFGDMGRCEQCHGAYNIPGEKAVYSIVIFLSTVSLMATVYLLTSMIVKKAGEALVDIIEESCGNGIFEPGIYLYEFDRSHYLSCLMFLLAIYKLVSNPGFLMVGSYIFSYVIVAVYHLFCSRLLFFVISLKFIVDAYIEGYEMIDGFYYYLLNLNWEKKYLKSNYNE